MTLAVNTYKAQLNYHDSSWGWGNEGTASQGKWDGTGNRTGVLYFPGLAALKGKIINKVSLTVTAKDAGNGAWADKTARFYRSANQGGIKTSLGANHKTGSQIGSITGSMYNNTTSYTPSFLGPYIAGGDDTFCLYDGSNTGSYFKWTAVTLTIDWSEPATQPTLGASSVELGQPVKITTTAANSAYRHKLRYKFGSAFGTIAENVEGSYSWTPPVTLSRQIPNDVSGTGTIYCDTYSGSTLLGTRSVAVTLRVPESVKPTAGTLTAVVTGDTSGTGLYVKGMGKAKLTLSGAAGAYDSEITSYKITGGGWSAAASTLTTGTLNTAGEITFTGKVTDSRGRTSDNVTCKITVVDYTRPGVSTWTVYRCDADGNKKNAGTYAAVEINADFSAITGNSLALTAAYKLATETSYSAETALTNNGKTVIGGGNLSAAKTYDVRITVADKYNTITIPTKLNTKKVIWSVLFKGLGFAFGKVAELSGWMDVAWNALFRKDIWLNTYDNAEKNLYLRNNAAREGNTYERDGIYPHYCKLYGGSGSSMTGIGFYDVLNGHGVVLYDDVQKQLRLGESKANLTLYLNGNALGTGDSGWIAAELTSSFTAYNKNTAYAPKYRKVLNQVEISGILSPTVELEASSSSTVFTLPEEYRPTQPVYVVCQGNAKNTWLLTVNVGGTVTVSRYGTTANTVIPTTAWLPLRATFFVD